MTLSFIFLRQPKALAIPGWKGGPAPYASTVLALVYLGAHARLKVSGTNDNTGRAS